MPLVSHLSERLVQKSPGVRNVITAGIDFHAGHVVLGNIVRDSTGLRLQELDNVGGFVICEQRNYSARISLQTSSRSCSFWRNTALPSFMGHN